MPTAGSGHQTIQLQRLAQARATRHVTQEEYHQHRDWYLGLTMLNGKTDNFITRRLWAGLWLPLGIEPHKEKILP